MARTRSTKWLAQRIDTSYHTRSHWLRSARWWTTVTLVLGSAVLLAASMARSERMVMPGPVSAPHAVVEEACHRCHATTETHPIRRHAADERCLTCHPSQAPAHHANQKWSQRRSSPSCGECHGEHSGRLTRIERVHDDWCVTCHADIERHATSPPEKLPRKWWSVSSFGDSHPDFLEPGEADPTAIRLNHELHLELPELLEELRSDPSTRPFGPLHPDRFRRLDCDSCHTPASGGAVMEPVDYEAHCRSCHALGFVPGDSGPVLPHAEPEKVHEALVETYRKDPGLFPAPSGTITPRPASPAETMRARIDLVERVLFMKTCHQCHRIHDSGAPAEAPIAARFPMQKPEIPERYLPGSDFTHRPHRMLRCVECHEGALDSRDTGDLLLPGKDGCASCHRSGAAIASCSGCHVYHRQTRPEEPGSLRIEEILTTAIPAEPLSADAAGIPASRGLPGGHASEDHGPGT